MRLQAIHEYTHVDGSAWWWIARWKDPGSGEKRPFPFHRGDDGSFLLGMPGIPNGARPLYLVHKLAQYPDDLVYLVEGESCADCLDALGFIATTWPNGAGAVHAADWTPLAGRRVVQWPDHDEQGYQAMEAARPILESLDARVVVLDAPGLGLPRHGDVVDWLARFVDSHGARELYAIPEGHALAWEAVRALSVVQEWAVAA
jgi:hypothetical protein